MSSITWIRHAIKAYDNNKNPIGYPAHDPPLLHNQQNLFQETLLNLLKGGHPDIIICSPYKRTVSTAKELASIINFKGNIIIDANISEYLGFQRPRYINGRYSYIPDVDYTTKKYKLPLIKESMSSLYDRCKFHLDQLINEYCLNNENPKNIWVITHGIVIEKIRELTNYEGITINPICSNLTAHRDICPLGVYIYNV